MRSGDCHFKLALCAAREAAGALDWAGQFELVNSREAALQQMRAICVCGC